MLCAPLRWSPDCVGLQGTASGDLWCDLTWGASGRWFKSSRPDHLKALTLLRIPERVRAFSFRVRGSQQQTSSKRTRLRRRQAEREPVQASAHVPQVEVPVDLGGDLRIGVPEDLLHRGELRPGRWVEARRFSELDLVHARRSRWRRRARGQDRPPGSRRGTWSRAPAPAGAHGQALPGRRCRTAEQSVSDRARRVVPPRRAGGRPGGSHATSVRTARLR